MQYLLAMVLCSASFAAIAQLQITPEEAAKHIGDSLTVCGKIFSGVYLQDAKQQPTLLNIGEAYPDNPFTAIIYGESRKLFAKAPEAYYLNSTVCFTGRVEAYKGKPQMIIYSPTQMGGAIYDKLNTEPE